MKVAKKVLSALLYLGSVIETFVELPRESTPLKSSSLLIAGLGEFLRIILPLSLSNDKLKTA